MTRNLYTQEKGYPVLDESGPPDLASSMIVVVMMLGWVTGQVLGLIRYR